MDNVCNRRLFSVPSKHIKPNRELWKSSATGLLTRSPGQIVQHIYYVIGRLGGPYNRLI